jgi:hypothetical protein
MYSYILIISMLIHGTPKEIGREPCYDLHACNVRADEIEYDYGNKGIYNIIIECKREMK